VDIATALFSVIVVVCDILVTYEYYLQGRMPYFYSSLAIFALAQLTYAFLFTATYCKSVRVQERVWVFCAVLPVAQLHPVFAWLETLRIPQLAAILRAAGLRDTTSEPMYTSDTSTYSAPATAEDGDSLLAYMQSRYQAQAGFLAEAFAEAIPQAILQSCALVQFQEQATPLTLVSLFMSISVFASKGYLLSFAIDRACFLLNFVSVVADIFAMFATATWVAADLDLMPLTNLPEGNRHHNHSGVAATAPAADAAATSAAADPGRGYSEQLVASGWDVLSRLLLVVTLTCAFAIADDHLKVLLNRSLSRLKPALEALEWAHHPAHLGRSRKRQTVGELWEVGGLDDDSGSCLWFDLYVVRPAALLFCYVPVIQ
jgi:hypothetical protein